MHLIIHKDIYVMRMQPTANRAKHLIKTCYAFAQNKIKLNSLFNYTFLRTIYSTDCNAFREFGNNNCINTDSSAALKLTFERKINFLSITLVTKS